MVSTLAGPDDLAVLGRDSKANVIRWQLGGTAFPEGPPTPGYDVVLGRNSTGWTRRSPSAGSTACGSWQDLHFPAAPDALPAAQESWSPWRVIAARYRDCEAVWAYDLANELGPGGDLVRETAPWDRLAERAARAVREIDPGKSPSSWSRFSGRPPPSAT